jgi:non-specific serine/threonine protein kinase
MAWQLRDRLCTARCLEELALVASARGLAERAACLFAAASGWWGAMGVRLLPVERADHDRGVEEARSVLGEAQFTATWSHGSALSQQQGVDLGLTGGEVAPTAKPPMPTTEHLTVREREVAILIAQGLTNHEIAERLVITRRTAEAHVTHVLTKLDMRSRAQIAVWAAQHGHV